MSGTEIHDFTPSEGWCVSGKGSHSVQLWSESEAVSRLVVSKQRRHQESGALTAVSAEAVSTIMPFDRCPASALVHKRRPLQCVYVGLAVCTLFSLAQHCLFSG